MQDSPCFICGSVVLQLTAGTGLLSCSRCRLEGNFTDSRTFRVGRSAEGLHYPAEGNQDTFSVEEGSFWFKHRSRVIHALMDNFPFDGSLLDVGGGNGYEALALQRAGRDVTMVEPGIYGCENARNRGVTKVVQSTLGAIALTDGSVGGLSFFDVLEHMDRPRELLAESLRLLKPGGRIYITVPAFKFLWSDEDIFAQHRRRYTIRSLRQEVEAEGFQVEFLSYFFQCLLPLIFLFRTIPYYLFAKKGESMDKADHSPPGILQKVLWFFLSREWRGLKRSRPLMAGSSLCCVARKAGGR